MLNIFLPLKETNRQICVDMAHSSDTFSVLNDMK
jgi:hypothetical protein